MSPRIMKPLYRAIFIHGIGDPSPDYWMPFHLDLEDLLKAEILPRAVYWGDLTRYVGLRDQVYWEGRFTARWADYALDVLKYTTDWGVRGEIRARVNEAVYWGHPDPPPTLLVTHSWGGVIAWNHFPHDEADLWMSFHTRRYLNTRLTRPPKVGKWVNVWSPQDALSGRIKGPENLMNNENHSPMWTSYPRAIVTSLYWKKYLESRTADR